MRKKLGTWAYIEESLLFAKEELVQAEIELSQRQPHGVGESVMSLHLQSLVGQIDHALQLIEKLMTRNGLRVV